MDGERGIDEEQWPAYDYGPADGQVDSFFREKRPWSETKDSILKKYIESYLKTVHARGRPIAVVDAFAGPGRFGDGTDGSPLIICKAIHTLTTKGSISVPAKAYFADIRPRHREELLRNLSSFQRIAQVPAADCAEAIQRVISDCSDYTLFFYLDPFGLKGLEVEGLAPMLHRSPQQSTEVLVNFSFPAFMRLAGNWEYDDSTATVDEKVKAAKIELVHTVMGGDYWLDAALSAGSSVERERTVVEQYKDHVLRRFFRFVVSCPVVSEEGHPRLAGVPEEHVAKYHLIFATRHPRGIQYMNDAMHDGLARYLQRFVRAMLFDFTPEHYVKPEDLPKKVIQIVEKTGKKTREEVIHALMLEHFALYKRSELRGAIGDLLKAGRLLSNNPRARTGRINDMDLLWLPGHE